MQKKLLDEPLMVGPEEAFYPAGKSEFQAPAIVFALFARPQLPGAA